MIFSSAKAVSYPSPIDKYAAIAQYGFLPRD